MIKKIQYTFYIFMLLSNLNSFSQLDRNIGGKTTTDNKSFNINSVPAKVAEKPISLDFKNNDGFKTAHAKQQQKLKKKQAEDNLKNKGVISPAMLRKMTLQKQAEKYSFPIPMIDKEMGSFQTFSKNINIKAFDFGLVDGDLVSVYKNGKLFIANYSLNKKTKIITVPLDIGFNDIEILAIDEGKYRPNTGAFTFFDDNGEVVVSDMWNLAKGAKVKALIIRKKDKN